MSRYAHRARSGDPARAAGLRQFLPQWTLFLVTVALAKGLVVLGPDDHAALRPGVLRQALYYCIGAYAAGMLAPVRRE